MQPVKGKVNIFKIAFLIMDVMVDVCQSEVPALDDNIKYFLSVPHYHLSCGQPSHWLEKFSLVSEKIFNTALPFL